VPTVRRVLATAAVLGLTVGVLASCAKPDFRYAAEPPGSAPAGTVYLKVPRDWAEFPAAQIASAEKGWTAGSDAAALLGATSWQAAYDAAPTPSLDHVLGRAAPDRPVVYASLRSLYAEEQAGATADGLKDLLVPISTLGPAVHVTTDATVTQGSASGVHLVYSYTPAPGLPEETIDQTAYLSDGRDAVYLLVVRCTTTCYAEHRDEIAAVTSSYTIEEGRSG
jgi:hypothetical protein